MLLESGDKVPADLRLLEGHNLSVQESALTGESVSVTKQNQPIPEPTPLAERSNMLYAGTLITQGRARAIVVSTGDDTELGHIGRLLNSVEPLDTPLTAQLDRLGHQLTIWIVLLALATFLFGWLYRDDGWMNSSWPPLVWLWPPFQKGYRPSSRSPSPSVSSAWQAAMPSSDASLP